MLYRPDAGLTAGPPFDEALQRLQVVKNAAVRSPSASYHQCIFEMHAERVIQLRTSKCDWQRRARHQWKTQFTRPVVHLLGLRPIVGKMLIDEYRDGASRFTEYLNHLFEE